MLETSKVSSDNLLKIVFVGWDEPNNGRMLWEVEVLYKGVNINETIFPGGSWNKINFQTDKWTLNDEDNKFYYIPFEATSILIIKENFQIINLPWQAVSTVRFVGNTFMGENLIEVYRDQIVITNLKKLTSKIKTIKDFDNISDFKTINKGALEVSEYNYHERLKHSRIVEIKK